MADSPKTFQCKLFDSFVHPSFWYKLFEQKIDVDGLFDGRKAINGFYTNSDALKCLLETDCTAFNKDFEEQSFKYQSHGAVFNKNKIEDFNSCDKTALVNEEGKLIWNDIVNGLCLKRPSLLSRFLVLAFAEMKELTYWFAYPSPSELNFEMLNEPILLSDDIGAGQIKEIATIYFELPNESRSFFILQKNETSGRFEHFQLVDKIDANKKEDNFARTNLSDIYFCFSDPCPTIYYAGWPLRLFLLMLTHFCPKLRASYIKILSLRVKKAISIENSVVFTIKLPINDIDANSLKWIGWEPNDQGKSLPKYVSNMDQKLVAKTGVYLNIKLMKWRLLPDLDLKRMSEAKCLLFGAGTLGCSVARNLIAWGIKHISFIDSGHVSFSNPVRQCLFTYDDAVNKKEKAKTASARLQEILPEIITTGYYLNIPMPGIAICESLKEKTIVELTKIEELVKQHDIIFLLTDSRESRWLPTVLAAAYDKIVINTALGFDSYLVMRHGCNPKIDVASTPKETAIIDGLECIRGDHLGCYFCNDITAPGDSSKDRTLDQQCTVTRPAVANIGGSLAVEMLISLLQHPDKSLCPAYISVHNCDLSATTEKTPEGLLGIIPHSIRGSVRDFEQLLPATERFTHCIACSKKILNEYRINGHSFLFNVFASSKYLEDLAGLSELINAQHEEILELDGDSDFETMVLN